MKPDFKIFKRIARAGCCALTLLSFSTGLHAQDAASIPVPNADFETGEKGAPAHWDFSNAEGGAGRLEWSEAAHTGKRAARIVKSNTAGYSMLVSDFIRVEAGKSYRVSAQVHVEGRSRAKVYFMVSQYADDKNEMRLPNAFSEVRTVTTGAGWQEISLVFPVREGSTRVRVHAIMAAAPIDVTWDDFQLHEAAAIDTSYKPRYEAPAAEVLPPLEPAIEALKKRKPVVAERRVIDGRVRFFIDGKETVPALYVSPFANYNAAHIADFSQAGVKLFLVPLILGRGVYGDFGPWLGKNQFDWKEVDERLWRILRVNPDANIIFYMATDPYLKWADENPDAIVRDQNDQKVVVTMHPVEWGRAPRETPGNYKERWGHSYVSSALRRDTEDALRRLVEHVQNSLPGKAVAGYHIAGGNDGQFFQWAGYKSDGSEPGNFHLADYSPASREAFRIWLKAKYKTEGNLRAAWRQSAVTFQTAAIPSGDRRLAKGFFFNAKTDEDIADYKRFCSEGTVETIHDYARVLKNATKNQKLVSTYWEDTAAGVESHFATGAMISSPDIDFLAGPTDYAVRMPGEVGECHSIWGSLMLHDKLWVSEQDWRSWHSTSVSKAYDYSVGRATTAAEHNAMVRRESGMMLAFGQGTWWYDMNGGWFADAGIMRGIKEAVQAFQQDGSTPGRPRADVAVFVSERSTDYLKEDARSFRYNSITQQIRELNHSGVPYQIFLQSDLGNPRLPDFKCYIFLNAQNIEPGEWRAIQKLKRDKKTLCFVHAPGIIKPETVGASTPAGAIEAVTGIKVRAVEGETILGLQPVKSDAPLPLDIRDEMLSFWAGKAPAFAVNDTRATTLGDFEGIGAGAAYRDFGNWKSVFFGGVGMSDVFLNALARQSGAWVASEAGDAVFANQHFMTIHALWDGEKTLRFLQPSTATDLTNGKVVAQKATTLKLDMKRGQTRWFYLEPKSTR
jgi:hypothetical protein